VNQHLDSLIALQRSTVTLGAAELLGRTVEVEASALSLTNGQSQMLRLPAGDSQNRSARITISNAAGTVVREAVAPLGTTAAEWSWDGRDNSGLALPNGSYRVGLTGLDASGVARGALTGSLTGVVTGIARQGETAMLQLGTLSVPVDALRSARP
jgi:flagellar basal-body rod modification protein FlgD